MMKRLVIIEITSKKISAEQSRQRKSCFQKSNGETVDRHNKYFKKKNLSTKIVSENVVFRNRMVKQLIIEIFQRNRKDPALKIK